VRKVEMKSENPDSGTSAEGPDLHLPNYLPYRLSVASNKASDLIARAYRARFGLTIWEWRVIAVLGSQAQPLTAQGVCEAAAADKVTISRAIRALNARGLVNRRLNARDRRASDVTLTPEGRIVYAEIAPSALACEAHMLRAFSSDERAELERLLDKLERSLDSGSA